MPLDTEQQRWSTTGTGSQHELRPHSDYAALSPRLQRVMARGLHVGRMAATTLQGFAAMWLLRSWMAEQTPSTRGISSSVVTKL